MASLNTLRGLLVAGAAVAAVLAALGGRWSVSALMLVAVGIHGLGTVWLRQHRAPAPSSGALTADSDGSVSRGGGRDRL